MNNRIQATTTVLDEEEVTQNLEDIEVQVSEALSELYRLEQLIQESNFKVIRIQEEKLAIQERIVEINEEILEKKEQLHQYETTLGQVLATYQRMGATSFLEIILEAESLKNFLQRVTLFRDMTQGTGDLMSKTEETLDTLDFTETLLQETQAALVEEERALLLSVEENQSLINQQEEFLGSLETEREEYEEQLNTLREAWIALKPVFKNASIGFSELASSGALSEDMVDVSISLSGITARITEADFNRAIQDNPSLPSMVFSFENDGVGINLNQDVLQLMGYFEVRNDYEIHYVATSGQFYGIELEPSGISELYEEGALILNIENLTDDNKVKSIESKENELILNFAFSFF
jgi:peptidoglycan hydrolase CwlO-like protein